MLTNFKKLLIIFLVTINLVGNICLVNADDNTVNISVNESYLQRQHFTDIQKQKPLTMKGLFTFYFNELGEGIPESYKYIELKFLNIEKNSSIYDALQKGVYLDLINNKPLDLKLNNIATEEFFSKLIVNNFDVSAKFTKGNKLTLDYFLSVMDELKSLEDTKTSNDIQVNTQSKYDIESAPNFPILNDVYNKLKNQHYDSEKFNDNGLIDGAIKGMAESSGDKHTAYFPPVDSKNFIDQLAGEFEGIGAHIEMEKPGILKIVAPLSGSPAEKAGLKAGDQIIKIDSIEVNSGVTLEQAISKVKGPAGTEVNLTIIRDGNTLQIKITRAKIILNYVDYSKLDNGDNYIKISLFGAGVATAFSGAVNEVIKNSGASKTIIDLRNNPGGSLDEVANMLDFFVPKGQSVVNIKYKRYSSDMESTGLVGYSFGGDKKVIILINKGSASASEIMAGTIRDYLGANVKIIGETSYGKGSVQSLDSYTDGSSFKFTIAKWFTGKTKTGIDGVGIKPDIELKLDEDKATNGQDNQLDFAKNYRF